MEAVNELNAVVSVSPGGTDGNHRQKQELMPIGVSFDNSEANGTTAKDGVGASVAQIVQ